MTYVNQKKSSTFLDFLGQSHKETLRNNQLDPIGRCLLYRDRETDETGKASGNRAMWDTLTVLNPLLVASQSFSHSSPSIEIQFQIKEFQLCPISSNSRSLYYTIPKSAFFLGGTCPISTSKSSPLH